MRRDPSSGLLPPVLKAMAILSIPVALTVLATQLDGLQQGLLTQPLTGPQWLACLGLALVTPVVVELDKLLRADQSAASRRWSAVTKKMKRKPYERAHAGRCTVSSSPCRSG